MTTMRLNSQVRQFYGLTHGQRVFGGAPKCRLGRWEVRILAIFKNPMDAQSIKTHHSLWANRQIRQASLTEDFNGKLDLCINRSFRQSRNGVFLGPIGLSMPTNRKTKGGTSDGPIDNYLEI